MLVHSFYSSATPSGENEVVKAQQVALDRAGVETHLVSTSSDDHDGLLRSARAAVRVATGRGRSPLETIGSLAPDLVHIHNLFPNFGRQWIGDLEVSTVATLHNFRPLCANAILFREGRVCRDCPEGDRWAGVRHACYRGSRLASLPLAMANRHGPMADPVLSRADRLIVMSELARREYVSAGVPPARLTVGPNFLSEELDPGPDRGRAGDGWLFVGRIDHTKGILRLLEHWPADVVLRVVGAGPEEDAARRLAAGRQVRFLGQLRREQVLAEMRGAGGLVFPSPGLEGSPLVLIEALAVGLPVLAFEPNVSVELVREFGVGTTTTLANLPESLKEAERVFPTLRTRCRDVFEAQFSERAYVERTLTLYESLLR